MLTGKASVRISIGIFRFKEIFRSFSGSTALCNKMELPTNEPVLDYRPGSKERIELEAALKKFYNQTTDVPIVIGEQELFSDDIRYQLMPFEHKRRVAKFSHATPEHIWKAIEVSMNARVDWEARPLRERVDILMKAADLCAGKYRMDLNAVTMLGQAKTIIQAEIDSACELVDFFRFNCYFALELEKYTPISTSTYKDTVIYRGLEGFVGAVPPFNFTAIGGNLATAPALMGNVVLWKPSDTAVLSNYLIFKVLREAGLPPGVINFIPCAGPVFGDTITSSPHFAGLNFTGSVPTFQRLWKQVAQNLDIYHNFPRLVGECGGKNFHFVHPSSDIDLVAPATIRASFEYQGQKCSANSRMFVPQSIWPALKDKLLAIHRQLKMASPLEQGTFLTAVIDKISFDRIKGYIDYAKKSSDLEVICGGNYDDSVGYFVDPTVIVSKNINDKLMKEEIFGPVLTIYVYPDDKCNEVLASVKDSTPYALTGAVFAENRDFVQHATKVLRQATGNFYINDKCTGSIVGQQPFGGARKSGTNDKAGGPHYVLRWTSPQGIKESLMPQKEWRYPSMD